MKISKVFYTLFIIIAGCSGLYSQCSDAGICILGHRDPEISGKKSHNRLLANYNLGFSGKSGGDFVINYFSVETDFQIFTNSRFVLIIPVNSVSGPIATETGFGDMLMTYTSYLPGKKLGTVGITLGVKLQTGSANLDGLPQAYQPGLGTNDLMFGLSSNSKHINLCAGYQIPFGRSPNGVTRLKRGQDLMLRFGYTQAYKPLTIQAEVIAIKSLQPSSVLVQGSNPEQFSNVDGTDEFQANLLGRMSYQTSKTIRLETYVAVPLINRLHNLDGLKRVFSFAATFSYMFDVDF